MKAVVLTAYGDVEKLELCDLPDPHAGPGAIVVRMAGASINRVDWEIRSGSARASHPVEFPTVLGLDASGEVVELGQGVTTFSLGDRVLGVVTGAYEELIAAPARVWAKIPPGLDVADAGALRIALLTGAQLIECAVAPSEGELILVTGTTGNVGRVAVLAAKERGARVWAGVRARQRKEAGQLGVEGVVALDDDSEIAELPTLDAIADTVDGGAIEKLYGKLKPGGVLGAPAGAKERGFVVHAFRSKPDAAMLARYAAFVADRRLVIPIARKMPLAAARDALAERGHPHGKVLLVA